MLSRSVPLIALNILTIPSRSGPPVAISLPLGENATECTGPSLLAWTKKRVWLELESWTVSIPFSSAMAMREPFAL
jgi:hypothetical protein